MREFLNSPLGVVLAFVAGGAPVWMLGWYLNRRDQRQWAQQEAERQRQWALQRQLWAMEHQIWDEQLSEEARERQRQSRARVAAVRREARRRLGLPEE